MPATRGMDDDDWERLVQATPAPPHPNCQLMPISNRDLRKWNLGSYEPQDSDEQKRYDEVMRLASMPNSPFSTNEIREMLSLPPLSEPTIRTERDPSTKQIKLRADYIVSEEVLAEARHRGADFIEGIAHKLAVQMAQGLERELHPQYHTGGLVEHQPYDRVAMYDTRCSQCGKKILSGKHRIARDRGSGPWVHNACARPAEKEVVFDDGKSQWEFLPNAKKKGGVSMVEALKQMQKATTALGESLTGKSYGQRPTVQTPAIRHLDKQIDAVCALAR